MNMGDKIAAHERAKERAIVIDRVLKIIDEENNLSKLA